MSFPSYDTAVDRVRARDQCPSGLSDFRPLTVKHLCNEKHVCSGKRVCGAAAWNIVHCLSLSPCPPCPARPVPGPPASMLVTNLLFRCCTLSLLLLKLFDMSIADTEALSVGKMRSSAEVFFANGEYDKALEMWAKVISLEPNNDTNYYKRFRIYLRQQKLKEALADLNAALTYNPQNENALTQRAKLNMRMGRCEDSEKDFISLKKYVLLCACSSLLTILAFIQDKS
jgi:hypothetical protein